MEGVYEHDLGLSLLCDGDPETLLIVDKSLYMEYPSAPTLRICLPGSLGTKSILFKPSQLNILTSVDLGTTVRGRCDIQDGYYVLNYAVEPHDEVYVVATGYKIDYFLSAWRHKLLLLSQLVPVEQARWEQVLGHAYLLVQQAAALAEKAQRVQADEFYREAFEQIKRLK